MTASQLKRYCLSTANEKNTAMMPPEGPITDETDDFASNVTPLLRKSAAERVVTQLIDLIRSGNLRAGDRLPTEADLARAFQVSRPIVREALRGLAVLGVAETRQGGRCFITDLTVARLMAPLQFVISLDESSIEALQGARVLIEAGIVREAALRITPADAAELDAMVTAGFALAGDALGFRVLDQQFHRTLNRLGGNPFLEVVGQSLYELGMEYRRRRATENVSVKERSAGEHAAIVAALKTGDPDRSAAAMTAHLASINKSTIAAMREASPARRLRHPRRGPKEA